MASPLPALARPSMDAVTFAPDTVDEKKQDIEHFDSADNHYSQVLKSNFDNLSPLQAARTFWKAVLLCSFLGIAAAADGFSVSMTSNIIANTGFIHQYGTVISAAGVKSLAAKHLSAWAAVQSSGQIIGMIGVTPISDRFGRKYTLYTLWVFLAACIFAECFGTNWKTWLIAKLLAGISVGTIQATLPLYLAEWSPVSIRGGAVMSYGIWWAIGAFFAPFSLSILKKQDPMIYKTPLFSQFGLLGVMGIVFLLVPESVWFLAGKGRVEEGKKNLTMVFGKVEGYDVDHELQVILNTLDEEKRMTDTFKTQSMVQRYMDCFRGVNKWRTLAAYLPTSCNHLTGLALLGTYSSYFFRQVGFSNAFTISSILFAVKIPTNIFVLFSTDYFGRRTIVLFCCTVCVIMLVPIACLGFIKANDSTRVVLIVLACFWVGCNNILGSVGWNYCSETGTQRLRAPTTGISAACGVIWGLIWNTSIPVMIASTPGSLNWGYKTAFLYVITGAISLVLVFFFVPEIARRSPSELDEMFDKKIPARKFKGYVTDVQKGLEAARQESA